MAKRAGIDMPNVHLFPERTAASEGTNRRKPRLHPGYFATQRFDRHGPCRFNMHTACGLLGSDYSVPALDYDDLLTLTAALTRDIREVEKMFRIAAFNVFAHNRDDHSKNFTFLMNADGQRKLSPAYDLTFSSGPRGEQSTTVMGEGRAPGTEELFRLAKAHTIGAPLATSIVDQVKASLSEWPQLASAHGISHSNRRLIQSKLA